MQFNMIVVKTINFLEWEYCPTTARMSLIHDFYFYCLQRKYEQIVGCRYKHVNICIKRKRHDLLTHSLTDMTAI